MEDPGEFTDGAWRAAVAFVIVVDVLAALAVVAIAVRTATSAARWLA